jgi:hypothetical protein
MPSAVPRAPHGWLARAWRQPRSARATQALGTPAPRAREPTQWPHAGDRYRATHRALPALLPYYADYMLRLQDAEPKSLEIMLRFLLVALPLVVASPAAFDAQEVDALQFEVQSPLQFEVRSPPKSRPLRPAATRDQHDSPATQCPLRTHTTRQAHTSQWTRRGTLECGQDDPPHDLLRDQHFRAQGYPPTIRRCAPARPVATHAAQLRSALPLRARGRCAC